MEDQLSLREQKETLEDAISDGKVKVELHQREGFFKLNFTNTQNTYLNNSIRFADTKAGALVAVNGLIAKFAFDFFSTETTTYIKLLYVLGLAFLIQGIILSVYVVFPKKLNRKKKGIIYWENINEMELDEYVETIEAMEVKELLKRSMENNYFQARILTRKFNLLHYAFLSSMVGFVILSVLSLILLF
ncbi:Pycsar system effector family protein [Metabacillus bambusae]|uniref:Pycsar effector protein domain-containing protein n=1 Tax=Metabacillus bambusae TaxID=2795218 RepID=A0ABS3N842_9BACI|nr:Pycsar system effector family protein [Metabacillus bambusae]MBO1514348.1 hypothetical protein [Metabacillus bambusae]